MNLKFGQDVDHRGTKTYINHFFEISIFWCYYPTFWGIFGGKSIKWHKMWGNRVKKSKYQKVINISFLYLYGLHLDQIWGLYHFPSSRWSKKRDFEISRYLWKWGNFPIYWSIFGIKLVKKCWRGTFSNFFCHILG